LLRLRISVNVSKRLTIPFSVETPFKFFTLKRYKLQKGQTLFEIVEVYQWGRSTLTVLGGHELETKQLKRYGRCRQTVNKTAVMSYTPSTHNVLYTFWSCLCLLINCIQSPDSDYIERSFGGNKMEIK